ncbi:hypothetical protein A2955_02555 [Candidatus Woesebacteria bacterium RIFCSPLOWO2_01_FULL_37_19]|uniref:Uncharacterized protein n=2 Tax=Candidatus Woeseibacteriota TaxID=1752722 RepID=A0A1F8B014_9BACT|nr:MAG: hypothetical protein A2771_04080 [Candidatus Woesebacteria bacterium RIFCSPHIGHO2_01_FULL_38_26b]OGM56788.1 MAG: hypothetical protein A2955_02555 [Candidatus Woesebacteria bacterium RIFCSPLOWO2_01_FULL_37_19]
MKINLPNIASNFAIRLIINSIFVLIIFLASPIWLRSFTIKAQIPPPYIPCNQVRSPEFHSLRPYQASPCNQNATELALYCGSSFVLSDTFAIQKTFTNPPTSWRYIYEGGGITPTPPEDPFNQRACKFCQGSFCVNASPPCIPDINQCESNADCLSSCQNNLDGTETCTFLVSRSRSVAIDLSDAEFPIMGNTDDLINSQNQNTPEALDAYDPTKVNEYVSWYLNGVFGRAEYPPSGPPSAPSAYGDYDIDFTIVDFSGPLKKLLAFESQIAQRISEIRKVSQGTVRHNQVVGCDNLLGNPTNCYPQRLGVFQRRLSAWLNRLPPRRANYNNFASYWNAYQNWRNGSPKFIGNLFDYIPFSSTEDRKGMVEAILTNIQPVQPGVTIIYTNITQTPADLFFAHIDETAQLGTILQKTFAFKGADLAGPASDVAPPANAYCDLVEVRSNPGDDLFAGEIRVNIDYQAQVQCSFYIPYPLLGAPEGNLCINLAGGTCQNVPSNYVCSDFYGQVDCPAGLDCANGCGPLRGCSGGACFPPSWGGCTGVRDPYQCPAGYTCAASCDRPSDPPNLTQECAVTVNINLGTVTKTPKADELWSRFVAGPAGIFRRVFPKIVPEAYVPIQALWDIPASTKVTFRGDGGVTYVGIPGSGRTDPELYFPHIGGIHQYFLKCIQRALRPQGFGEPCLSGSPGTNPPKGICPNVPDSQVPGKWLGTMKTGFINSANLWCAGRGENLAEECYNYVVTESINAGVNPAFSLTIWLNETAASNYECSGSGAQDFGINDSSIAMNIIAQLERFLVLPYSSLYLSCRQEALSRGLDPMFGFLRIFRAGLVCDLTQNDTNPGWDYYNDLKNFTWPLVTGPIRVCSGARFGIQWPTDFACP